MCVAPQNSSLCILTVISGSFRHYQYTGKRTVLWLQRTCLEIPRHYTPRLLLGFGIDAFHIFVCVWGRSTYVSV